MLAAIGRGNDWLRAVTCTIARRGAAFHLRHPERAEGILRSLTRYPLYKAGQFLFDLLEWEDFMLDGPPPPIVPTTLDDAALERLRSFGLSLRGHLDSSAISSLPAQLLSGEPFFTVSDNDLPALEASFYLYQDFVLGLLVSAAPLLAEPEVKIGG